MTITRSSSEHASQVLRHLGLCPTALLNPLYFILILPMLADFGGADEPKLEIPQSKLEFDLTSENAGRRVRFLDDGMCFEIGRTFFMFKHHKMNIDAKIPGPGQFFVTTGSKESIAEVQNARTNRGFGRAELRRSLETMSLDAAYEKAKSLVDDLLKPSLAEAKKERESLKDGALRDYLKRKRRVDPNKPAELHKAYIRVRGCELGKDLLKPRLNEIAEKKPLWVDEKEQSQWPTLQGIELSTQYRELLACEIMEDYLTRIGLEIDEDILRTRLKTKFEAVHVVVSGLALEKKEEGRKIPLGLDLSERAFMRDRLTVRLRCQFFPAVDRQDANSQWFLGQKVTCVSSSAKSIRVEGTLDPAAHDKVDWWNLVDYDPNKVAIKTPADVDVEIDPPFQDDHRTLLRVRSRGNEPVSYWFELHPTSDKRGEIEVLIHETASPVSLKFPF